MMKNSPFFATYFERSGPPFWQHMWARRKAVIAFCVRPSREVYSQYPGHFRDRDAQKFDPVRGNIAQSYSCVRRRLRPEFFAPRQNLLGISVATRGSAQKKWPAILEAQLRKSPRKFGPMRQICRPEFLAPLQKCLGILVAGPEIFGGILGVVPHILPGKFLEFLPDLPRNFDINFGGSKFCLAMSFAFRVGLDMVSFMPSRSVVASPKDCFLHRAFFLLSLALPYSLLINLILSSPLLTPFFC